MTGSKIVYENPWIRVREDAVIRPDGKPGIYGTVTAPAGVCILPIDDEGNVYLQQEYHYAVENDDLELTAGGFEDGLSPLENAKRELEEETGLTADEWIELGPIQPLTSVMNIPQYLFIAKKLHQGTPHLEPTEIITIHKVPFEEAYRPVINGSIKYAPACILILRAKLEGLV